MAINEASEVKTEFLAKRARHTNADLHVAYNYSRGFCTQFSFQKQSSYYILDQPYCVTGVGRC